AIDVIWGQASAWPLRERQVEREGRAAARLGRHPDPAVHAPDELLADVEAEPGAADPSRHVGVEAVELVEDSPLLRVRNPEPLVADGEPYVLPLTRDLDLDDAAVGRVLDGVVEEVDEHLPDLVRIARDGRRRLRGD